MPSTARAQARAFLEGETQFRLGRLMTEQAHPKTVGLAEVLQRDTTAGIALLQAVDVDVPPLAARVLASAEFARLRDGLAETLRSGRRVFFTGCGATGRLSILLEACWRRFWRQFGRRHPTWIPRFRGWEERVASVMAGGDFALIRSVEGFEDFTDFGRHQLRQLGVRAGDAVVAITEGGETSFVIGTAWEGLDSGARTFFVCNNPADVLAATVERSRRVIEEARITKIMLASGPMAVAGSTRMQATTAELLVVGAALEQALLVLLAERISKAELADSGLPRGVGADAYVAAFSALLRALTSKAATRAVADLVEYEEHVYRAGGFATYVATDYLLDILTDTTERNPTFNLPPFRRCDDLASPRSWAFVKHPWLTTEEAWTDLLQRPPRGLTWTADDYARLGAPEPLRSQPPRLDNAEIHKFRVGCEDDPSRYQAPDSAAILVLAAAEPGFERDGGRRDLGTAYRTLAAPYARRAAVWVGAAEPGEDLTGCTRFHVPCRVPASPLDLWSHLALKLVLNTLSTATMGRMARVVSNWMVYVSPTNKKLVDRGTRLISELAGVSYDDACVALYEASESLRDRGEPGAPVVEAIRALGAGHRLKDNPRAV